MPLISNSLRTLSAALITAALVITLLVVGRDILMPLALSVIACFILVPMVRWLTQVKFPEWLAVTTVVGLVSAVLLGASIALSSQLLSLAAELPAYRTNVVEKVRSVSASSAPSGIVSRAIDAVSTYRTMISRELHIGEDPAAAPGAQTSPPATDEAAKRTIIVTSDESSGWRGLSILAEPLAQTALTFLFTLFLLLQYRDLRDRVVRVLGTENMSETTAAMSDAGERLSDLFIGQLILNAGFGFVVGCALLLIGVPNAALWGVVAFVMRFVPFIGIFIAAIPPILLAAAVDPGWTKAIMTLVLFLVGEPIMGQVLEPLVLGKRAGLSPFAMVLSASFWTSVWGPIGLVLAAPLTLLIVVLGKYVPELSFVSVLLGNEPPLSKPYDFYHRLLSGDAMAASKQIEEEEEGRPVAHAIDEIIFPALLLAENDRRRGRLDTEDLDELEATIDKIVKARCPERAEIESPQVIIVPARGSVDILATRFAECVANEELPDSTLGLTHASGLTALSEVDASYHPEVVAINTVGGISERTIAILTKRARAIFPNARIVVLDFTKSLGSSYSSARQHNSEPVFNLMADFLRSVRTNALKANAVEARADSSAEVTASNIVQAPARAHS
ncbi:AI-2E family transporter [Hyphomicrobium methylovorum]|uniref:AI-2E family transporter n=1 Tax=Hyphomicrobium methylovorum TaxID=84 RepID=UPI0015E73835|nr:AI-2E family transporter [Hyphomicrobium methylovorum]MBA2125899.1 AI-2E family transporter [Hyphomicrobium methylovorum]